MNFSHYLTIGLGAVLTVAPQFMSFVPAPYADAATAIFGLLTSIYHLQTPTPAATQAFGQAAK